MKPPRQHSLLYILRPDGEPGEFEQLGESNSVFPTLWQVLFAESTSGESPAIARVMSNITRDYRVVDAQKALSRGCELLDALADIAHEHPVYGLQPYLAACRDWLRDVVAQWTLVQESPPVLLATLDEMRVSGATPDFAAARYQQIKAAVQSRDITALEQHLGFAQAGLGWPDWRAWSGVFGFALFVEPYFADAFRAPLPYAWRLPDAVPATAEFTVGSITAFRTSQGVGLRDFCSGVVILAPVHDEVRASGCADRVWLRQQQRWALAGLRREDMVQMLTAFIFDDVWPFSDERAVVLQQERYGVVDREGQFIVAACFDEIDDFHRGCARVRRGQQWGVIDVDGVQVIPSVHEHIEWHDGLAAWQVHTGDRVGVVAPDGQLRIDPQWERIEVAVPRRWLRVERDQQVGMLTWDGSAFLPCEYDSLEIVSVQRLPQTPPALHIVAQRAGDSGLLDDTGAIVLPLDFASIETIEPHEEPEVIVEAPHLLRITARTAGRRPHAGVFDLCTGTWRVACEYDFIWLLALPTGYGFLVARRCFDGGPRFRVGVLGSDGATLIAPDYAWIGDNSALTLRDAREHVREAICFGWLRGRPIQAQRAGDAALVWLYANGACSQVDDDDAAAARAHRALPLNG